MENSNTKTASIFLWSAVQRFGSRIVLFIANIILARLLSPSDFGCVGLLTVFIGLSDIFINGGFASALIQKKNPTQTDYSSVFYVNLSISVLCYLILFFTAPAISKFYHIEILTAIIRIQMITLIFNAFNVVQTNILQKNLKFKKLAIIENLSCFLGCSLGIISGMMNMGVWSLVVKNIAQYLSYSLLIWLWDSWRPSLIFSLKSVKNLFQFGGYMFLSSFTNTFYVNFPSIVIGRLFSSEALGYYTQARKLEELPVVAFSNVVSSVSYPLYSKMQDNKIELVKMLRKNIATISYLNFPLMALLIIAAKPLIQLLFGDKWLPSTPYFQTLCIAGLLTAINISNRDIFAALGKSRTFFYSQMVYKLMGIGFMTIGLYWSIAGLVWGWVAAATFLFLLNTTITKRLINYGLLSQLHDVLPNLTLTLGAAIPTFLLMRYIQHLGVLIQVLVIGAAYAVLYLLLSAITRNEIFFRFYKFATDFTDRYMPWRKKQ